MIRPSICFFTMLFCLATLSVSYAQDFYVAAPINFPVGNKAYKLNVASCGVQEIFSCPPTNNIGQYPENQFTDIAIDSKQNLYWVSGWGSFYKRSLSDSSCEFLGTFDGSNSINALVADSLNTIYAAGNFGGKCTLYKYQSGVFSTLGTFPADFFSAGDLFFYEQRLFLAATDGGLSRSFLVEVNIKNPEQSCYYMGLENYQPYGGFSVKNGTSSKAYIVCTENPTTSSLRELNITDKTVSPRICYFPFLITGTATYYERTSNSSACSLTTNLVAPVMPVAEYLKIESPLSTAVLNIITNIPRDKIADIRLFSASGQLVKQYSLQRFPNNLEVFDIVAGMYILKLTKKNGSVLTRKILKLTR